jgi:hypothetical protein
MTISHSIIVIKKKSLPKTPRKTEWKKSPTIIKTQILYLHVPNSPLENSLQVNIG